MTVKAPREPPANMAKRPLTMRLPDALPLDDEMLLALASANPELRFERNAQGDLIVMPPTGYGTSDRNAEITMQLRQWAKREDTGRATDSSGGFRLPSGAVRSPDAAWTSNARLEALSREERRGFAPLCPEFVLELLSPSDDLEATQAKMREYLENGARLGWLIDPESRRVYVYTAEGVDELEHPDVLSGEPVLRGFELDLGEVW